MSPGQIWQNLRIYNIQYCDVWQQHPVALPSYGCHVHSRQCKSFSLHGSCDISVQDYLGYPNSMTHIPTSAQAYWWQGPQETRGQSRVWRSRLRQSHG